METRPRCRVHAIQFTEIHVDNNNMTSMPYLNMQYKPYSVELPPTKEAYNKYVSTSTPYMRSLNQQFNNRRITLCL